MYSAATGSNPILARLSIPEISKKYFVCSQHFEGCQMELSKDKKLWLKVKYLYALCKGCIEDIIFISRIVTTPSQQQSAQKYKDQMGY
jgi:hypothetical protein